MRQSHLESAVARRTGESVRTIQQRGFGLLREESDRPARRVPANSAEGGLRSGTPDAMVEDFLGYRSEI